MCRTATDGRSPLLYVSHAAPLLFRHPHPPTPKTGSSVSYLCLGMTI